MTDPMLGRRRFLAGGLAAAGTVALASCGLGTSSMPDESTDGAGSKGFSGSLVSPPLAKPTVRLTALDGTPYDIRTETKGQLTLLFFGYTSCPDICPVYLNTLARAQASLGGSPGSRAKVLFVGVDTKRDTPKAIRKFLDAFDESFIGLTGSPTAIADAAAELHLPAPTFEEPDAKGNYVVGHPSQVTVFTPDDKAHRIYPYGVRQAAWVHDLPLLAEGRYR